MNKVDKKQMQVDIDSHDCHNTENVTGHWYPVMYSMLIPEKKVDKPKGTGYDICGIKGCRGLTGMSGN